MNSFLAPIAPAHIPIRVWEVLKNTGLRLCYHQACQKLGGPQRGRPLRWEGRNLGAPPTTWQAATSVAAPDLGGEQAVRAPRW
jgi:hypothetical protein